MQVLLLEKIVQNRMDLMIEDEYVGPPAVRMLDEILDEAILQMNAHEFDEDDDEFEDDQMEVEIIEEVFYQEPRDSPPSLYTLAIRKHLDQGLTKIDTITAVMKSMPTKVVGDILDEARKSCVCSHDGIRIGSSRTDLPGATSTFTFYSYAAFTQKDIFQRLLREYDRFKLHTIVQEFFNAYIFFSRVDFLITKSVVETGCRNGIPPRDQEHLRYILDVADFMAEAGWYRQSAMLLNEILMRLPQSKGLSVVVKCLRTMTDSVHHLWVRVQNRLVYSYVMEGDIKEAKTMLSLIVLARNFPADLRAEYYGNISGIFYAEGNFQQALKFAITAFCVAHIGEGSVSRRTYIEVLRYLSRSLAVTRNFSKALVFSRLCLYHAAQFEHKFADALLNHAYCLMQDDRNHEANLFYQKAKVLRERQFGRYNSVQLASVYEDLSYSCYVKKYRVGNFIEARHYIRKSMSIYQDILPKDHLQLSSAKRVLALIIEEEALDIPVLHHLQIEEQKLKILKTERLEEAHKLQKESLEVARRTFGEYSVLTAKHLGNLGRLYQSMKHFEDAESLHKKAIEIKTKILGDDDPEVAVSLGHLASLYNYDMKKYKMAEKLYLKGIEICKKHHGGLYSGLEYDYTGLINVYLNLGDEEKHQQYVFLLGDWKDQRREAANRPNSSRSHDEFDPNMSFESMFELIKPIAAEYKIYFSG
ncbi:Oidioi.mRNA.OKI2018_I69.PAR.g12712.t1.cds [Oikopleura dioica]|uniref:Oidioi.mRNA.OKI2018_I69.PAR.g12712.t1.cds n=1 Tax=Oikopleura dioica TaxID=34765 RepID=A0ABN7S893_OIKDI|nr:Oidioi.mRNA.OKI2018_I69.PAR.g12712.t1.cds [Oikopleura dioica]